MKAWAKINLTLDVLGKRSDGYHELSSVMQSISLYDNLIIKEEEQPGIQLTVSSRLSEQASLPTDDNNLVYQAAKLISVEYNVKQGISIELQKNIPIAAGLAGGSSDCAATILGLNELFALKIPQQRLFEIGRQLGADVPFCLLSHKSPTAVAEGIGERLTVLPSHPPVNIVLARLPVLVSTKDIFTQWSGFSENQTPAMIKSIRSLSKIAENLANDLTPISTGLHPEILELIMAFREENAMGVNMTGSGPTVFAYFSTEADALAAIRHMARQFTNCEFYFTETRRI